MKKAAFILTIILVSCFTLQGQKKSITIDDYGRFRSVAQAEISEMGNWAGFTYQLPRGDDTLIIKSLETDRSYTIPLGSNVQFSDNEKWATYRISLPFKKRESLKLEKKPTPEKAGLINLSTGEKEEIEDISAAFFTKGSDLYIVLKNKADPKDKSKGRPMVVKDLKRGTDNRFDNVSEFSVNKKGTLVAFTVETPDSVGNGLFIIETASNQVRALDTDRQIYSKPTWNEEGTVLACLKGITPKGKQLRENSLISFTNPATGQGRFEYNPAGDTSFPAGFVVSENRAPGFSSDNSVYYFGIKEQDEKIEKKKDAPPVANVDIWHWNDERIQSVQMKSASRDKQFTYLSAVRTDVSKFTRLADSTMRFAELSRNGKRVIGRNDKPYISDYKEILSDYYNVNPLTGERTLIIKGIRRDLGFSPDSRNFLIWKESEVWNYIPETGKFYCLTSGNDVVFENQEFDRAAEKPPYGVAGWTADGKSVILYSRYDLWLQPLSGGKPTNLTNGYGTANEIILRYINTDEEEKFIDLKRPLLLSAFGQWTKKAGFMKLEKGNLKELVYTDNYWGRIKKPKKADKYFLTRESPSEYPDYYVSDNEFKNLVRISDANPIIDEFNWYHNELIEYTNSNGVRLQGVLMIPDSYEPGKKYPMIVDFYEKNSQNLNRWSRIIYRDTPMFPKYASNDYLVLLPDVHFNIGSTHSDHLECVTAAVNKVIGMGYADPDRIGLHGHSFSGQGGNYIVTHSDLFACAVIGAGASNLVSDFNQLWKGSGSNQHGYDYTGQGRFNTNPYDNLQLYIDQSAVYSARNMNTPLMLFHGVDDGSVEWLQAVEFYNALRFNRKNVILASYPGEDHHLAKYENQVDFQTRMEQFYDHYLKGKPAPSWMIKGIPFLEKEARE